MFPAFCSKSVTCFSACQCTGLRPGAANPGASQPLRYGRLTSQGTASCCRLVRGVIVRTRAGPDEGQILYDDDPMERSNYWAHMLSLPPPPVPPPPPPPLPRSAQPQRPGGYDDDPWRSGTQDYKQQGIATSSQEVNMLKNSQQPSTRQVRSKEIPSRIQQVDGTSELLTSGKTLKWPTMSNNRNEQERRNNSSLQSKASFIEDPWGSRQQQQGRSPYSQPRVLGSKASDSTNNFARRLYKNEKLRALVDQDQENRISRSKQWKQQGTEYAQNQDSSNASLEQQQKQQQRTRQSSRSDVGGADGSMPKPPGFFSSREESAQFMQWMAAKRAARMKQLEKSHDSEVAGIALVYLGIALVVIALALSSIV